MWGAEKRDPNLESYPHVSAQDGDVGVSVFRV